MRNDQIRIDAPEKCSTCGLTRETMNQRHEQGILRGGWTIIPLMPGLAAFGCPDCHCLMMNTNAQENIAEINREFEQQKQSRILNPGKVAVAPDGRVVDLRTLVGRRN